MYVTKNKTIFDNIFEWEIPNCQKLNILKIYLHIKKIKYQKII